MATLRIESPVDEATVRSLRAGDRVYITGVIYTARDAAHQRIAAAMQRGEPPPFDIRGQTIYYTGPAPAKPGRPIGAAGPTTSGRMDSYSPLLIAAGLKVMIGKGARSPAVREAMQRYGAVYLAAIGGAGALISTSISKAEVIAYQELGTEAVRRLEVEDFPATVINDVYGADLYQQARIQYRRQV